MGVRVTPHPLVRSILAVVGGALTSTSLNLPGEEPATTGDEAERVVRELGGDDVWVLDAGVLPPSPPSTVVDCTGDVPVLLREGAVPLSRLRCAVPEAHERTR